MKKGLIGLLVLTSLFLVLSDGLKIKSAEASGQYIAVTKCINGDPITKYTAEVEVICEISTETTIQNKITKLQEPLPLILTWDLGSIGGDCAIDCTKSDNRPCTGALTKDGDGYASKSYSFTKLKPQDEIKFSITRHKVEAGNIYQIYCMSDKEAVFSNRVKIINACPSYPPMTQSGTVYSQPIGDPTGKGVIKGSADFMNKLNQLLSQMRANGPTPDRCDPLKFDNGKCYLSTDGQYRNASNHAMAKGGAVDIVCNHNSGTDNLQSLDNNYNCEVVNKLIERVRQANGDTKFSGIRECTTVPEGSKEISIGMAHHLHIDLRTNTVPKPCLFENNDWAKCLDF